MFYPINMTRREYEDILSRASKDFRPESKLANFQILCLCIQCIDRNREWNSKDIVYYLKKVYKQVVKVEKVKKIPRETTLRFDPEQFYQLCNVYDSIYVSMLIDSINERLKKMKLRKDLTTSSIDKFIFMAAIILFVFLYSQNIDPSQKLKVNIFLTENEIVI